MEENQTTQGDKEEIVTKEEVVEKQISTFEEKPVTLGKSAVTINVPLGIGTWSWGSKSWGFNSYDKSFNESTLEESFFQAVQNNLNFFDTAEAYSSGQSEQFLGTFLKKLRESENPKPVVIATKFLPLPWKVTQGSLKEALTASLKRLGLPCVDLYQIHGTLGSFRSVEVWAEVLAECVKEGLIKAVGVSNYNSDQLKRTHQVLASKGLSLASNQVEFSLLRNNAEKTGMLKLCKELGVTIIAYSPLGMGRLSGKYSKDNPPPSNRNFGKFPMEEIEPILNALKEIGSKYSKSPSQVALNWVICKGAIPIVGVKTKKQLDENLGAVGWRLSEEEIGKLDKLSKTGPWRLWQENS